MDERFACPEEFIKMFGYQNLWYCPTEDAISEDADLSAMND